RMLLAAGGAPGRPDVDQRHLSTKGAGIETGKTETIEGGKLGAGCRLPDQRRGDGGKIAARPETHQENRRQRRKDDERKEDEEATPARSFGFGGHHFLPWTWERRRFPAASSSASSLSRAR